MLSATKASTSARERILSLRSEHPCARHTLFRYLQEEDLTRKQAAAFLRNYDAHASVLRRLLLKAATIMPEPAVGFVLENVRNEYGNGNYAANHQEQLRSLARACGITDSAFLQQKIQPGVRHFIATVSQFYYPPKHFAKSRLRCAAISAGAITATELLAVEEFQSMQLAFKAFNLDQHIWFDHVTIEQEHIDESLALAMHFAAVHDSLQSVEVGLLGVLDANLHLYDGLLQALTTNA